MASVKKTDSVSAIPAAELADLKAAAPVLVEEATGNEVEVVEYEETVIDLGNGSYVTNYGARKA